MRTIITTIGIILFLFTAGCSSPVPVHDADQLSKMLEPQKDRAKLVLYYPYSYVWNDRIADVRTAGSSSSCRLKSGHFAVYDVKPGILTINTSLCNGNQLTTFRINVKAGNKYYVQIIPNDKSVAGRIAASGTYTAQGNRHVEGAAFNMDLVSQDYALQQLPWLKEAPPARQSTY